jgi:endoglucanase
MKVVFSYGIVLAALFLNVAGLNAAEQKSSRLVFSGYEGKEVLKDFPALVKLPGGLTGFDYKDAAPNGSDIAFYGEDGKKLSHEIDSWDVDGDSYIWVKVPQVSKTTAIVAKWGGSSKPLAKSSDVWSDDYLGVWHFSKFKKGISKDSKYGLEAKLRGKDTRKFIHADSLVGKGYFASSHTTHTGSFLVVDEDPRWTRFEKTKKLTVSFLVFSMIDGDAHARLISNKPKYGSKKGFEVACAGGEKLWSCGQGTKNFFVKVDKLTGNDQYSFRDLWAHVTVVFDGVAGESRIYYNGKLISTDKAAEYAPVASGWPLAIGHNSDAICYEHEATDEYFCGYIDEVRLANGAMSPDRIRAEYLTLTRPTQFAVAEGGKVETVLPRRVASGETPAVIPDMSKWRGVNAVSMFYAPWNKSDPYAWGCYPESEFAFLSKLGVNFARLPIDYRFFVSANDWEHFLEEGLETIDAAVAAGRKHGIHINLGLYRAPGHAYYPKNRNFSTLQSDPGALEAFKRIWSELARRYKGIPNTELSFNLVNEPYMSEKDFIRVFSETVKAIHKVDPGRFVILDANKIARVPVPYFYKVPMTGFAIHCYEPSGFTHWHVTYGNQSSQRPRWPKDGDKANAWVKKAIHKKLKVFDSIPKDYPVMVGEFGCYATIDHKSALSYMKEYMAGSQKNLNHLMAYAKKFQIESVMRTYTEVML